MLEEQVFWEAVGQTFLASLQNPHPNKVHFDSATEALQAQEKNEEKM